MPHNERLEFLGDSVLGLVVAHSLFVEHPNHTDGQLSKLKAAVVNMRALADVARTLGLGDYILLGRGEEGDGGRDKASILADTMEAVIATVYLCGGLSAATAFIHHLLGSLMESSARLGAALDWKTSLQELAASSSLGWPTYHVTEDGPDHQKSFHAEARVGMELLGAGSARTKKEAEQLAAEGAWTALDRRANGQDAAQAPDEHIDRQDA